MNYIVISNSSEGDEIGRYPQADTYNKGYNPGAPDGDWQVCLDTFPDFIPKVELVLNKNSKITNALSTIASTAFVVDQKIVDILERFNLPKYHIYPVKIYNGPKCLDYLWFHYVVNDFWKQVNLYESKAVIIDTKKDFAIIDTVNLHQPPETFQKLQVEVLPYHHKMIWEKLVFKSTLPEYDLYRIGGIQYFNIISERLAKALIFEGITGLSYGSEIVAYRF